MALAARGVGVRVRSLLPAAVFALCALILAPTWMSPVWMRLGRPLPVFMMAALMVSEISGLKTTVRSRPSFFAA